MRRTIVALTLSLSILAACTTAAAEPAAPTTTVPAPACDRACWEQIKQRQADERLYWAEVVKQQKARAEAARIARIYAYAHAVEQARLARLAAQSGGRIIDGIEVCGSWFPCYIVKRESGFNPRARNPRSTAGGLYQTLRFWVPWCGLPYANMAEASVAEQVACAKKIVRTHGLSPWALTR